MPSPSAIQRPARLLSCCCKHLTWLKSTTTAPQRFANAASTCEPSHCGVWIDLLAPTLITKPIVEAFQRHLFRHRKKNGQPLAWSGQHLHLKEVRQFFAWLAKLNHIPFNPAAEHRLAQATQVASQSHPHRRRSRTILSQPDATTPLGLRDRAIFEYLLLNRHCRAEVCGLRLDDIHVDRQSLFINQGKGRKTVTFRSACGL